MSNRHGLKKCIFIMGIITATLLAVFICVVNIFMKNYNRNNNEKLEAILAAVHERYPELSYNELMEVLEETKDNYRGSNLSDNNSGDNEENPAGSISGLYGIDMENDTFVVDNSSAKNQMILIFSLFVGIEAAVIIICFLIYDKKRERDIRDITRCIENINHKIYHMDVDSNTEDELSILKNEIYKTTIMLKEDAENSKLAQNLLKDSLSDISHQLKTPLTSITIMLDNMYDNPDMEPKLRQKFLRDMRREIANISFMVQSLLKLSRLEANTVVFKNDDISLTEIVSEAIKNVSALSDLKDVRINIDSEKDYMVCCDKRWQIEAVSNILKNSIEHSQPKDTVDISMDENHVYTALTITNHGEMISEKDLSHLFERFYQGEHATADSVGIGLALAKSIVEGCGGDISVDSEEGRTSFCIKYFK